MHNWGGTTITGDVSQGHPQQPRRDVPGGAQAHRQAAEGVGRRRARRTSRYHVDFNAPGSKYKEARQLAEDLVPIFNADLLEFVAHGAEFIQIEDLGAWMLALDPENDWVIDVLNAWIEGVDAKIALALLPRRRLRRPVARAIEDALPRVLERWDGGQRGAVRARLRSARHGRREGARGSSRPTRRSRSA